MNRVTQFLFGHLCLTEEERARTERLHQAVLDQRTEAEAMSGRIQHLQRRNHFGERIRHAFEAAEDKERWSH